MRLLIALPLLWLATSGLAAKAAEPPQKPPPVDLSAVIEILKNDRSREALIQQLRLMDEQNKKPVKPDENDDPISDLFKRGVTPLSAVLEKIEEIGSKSAETLDYGVKKFGRTLSEAAKSLSKLPEGVSALARAWRNPEQRQQGLTLAGTIFLLAFGALISKGLLARALRRPRQQLADRPSETKLQRWLLLGGRFLLDLLPPLAFAIVAQLILFLGVPKQLAPHLALFINATLIVFAALLLGRLILSPDHSRFRLIGLKDQTAADCYVWLRRIVLLGAYGPLSLESIQPFSPPKALTELIGHLIGLTLTGMVITFILQKSVPIRMWLRSEDREEDLSTSVNQTMQTLYYYFTGIWHFLAIPYVVVAYILWAFALPGTFLFLLRTTGYTLLLLFTARGIKHWLRHFLIPDFAARSEFVSRFPGLQTRVNRYLPALKRILSLSVNLLTLVLLLQIWGIDSLGWLTEGGGRPILSALLTILATLFTAVLIWEVFSAWIERLLQENGGDPAPSARLRTLLPLLRNALLIVLVGVVALIILSEIGLNVAPLLAGAGVVGLAIGFGSQTLVKDLITGLFILIEGSIAVGDSVDLAGKSGLVEAMTIRTIRLRDLRGAVHTIPFSAVTTIQNNTKNFSFVVADLGVDYNTNLDLALKTLQETDESLRAKNQEYAESVLDPLEIFGLERFEDSAMILRVRVKTKPGKQWAAGRIFNRGIKEAFDRVGISIPFPQQVVHHTTNLPVAAENAAD